MKIPASVTILTRNSAATLERCLASVQAFDDIVVLDGNSTDGTRAIAERYGARVLPQTDSAEPAVRITDFTEVRQKSFDAAKHDWVYMIDSDEWASPEQVEAVRGLVAADRTDEVYLFRKLAVLGERVVRHAYYYPDYSLRMLAKSGGAHWVAGRRVHERIVFPERVRQVRRDEPVYSLQPPYRDALRKDEYYLRLALDRYRGVPRRRMVRNAAINVAKGCLILGRVAAVHLRHGFRDTMPPMQHLRYPRYHWRLAWLLARRALSMRPYAHA